MRPSELIISALRGEPPRAPLRRALSGALISENLFKQANAMYRELLARGTDEETAAAQVQRAMAERLGNQGVHLTDKPNTPE
jgi:hypothetical protein